MLAYPDSSSHLLRLSSSYRHLPACIVLSCRFVFVCPYVHTLNTHNYVYCIPGMHTCMYIYVYSGTTCLHIYSREVLFGYAYMKYSIHVVACMYVCMYVYMYVDDHSS